FTGVTPNGAGPDANTMGSYVGALVVDPRDGNVVYVRGSDMGFMPQQALDPTLPGGILGPPPQSVHGLLRIDTRDIIGNGDNLDRYFVADQNDSDGIPEWDPTDPIGYRNNFYNGDTDDRYPDGITYFGEGAFWYDLSQDTSGIPSFTANVPAIVHSLTLDAQGRLLIGTDRGIWRANSYGFSYDYSGGSASIIAGTNKVNNSVGARYGSRSEEHTSELQSPCNLVCRLLLEKKK